MSKLYITNIQIVYEELLMYEEYTRLLINLLDLGEKERKAELANLHKEFKYLNAHVPDWFSSLNIENDILVKLSSSSSPAIIIVNTGHLLRGIRFGTDRPNKVEVLWTSKNLDLKQESIQRWIQSKLKPALDKDYNVDLEDLIKRSIFVRSMKG